MLDRRNLSAPRFLGRTWLLLAVALRVLTVLVGLQFSGVIHGVSDVLDAVTVEHEAAHEQCPVDGPCNDCPPGCPNCHCSASSASVVAGASGALATELVAEAMPPCLYATQAPSRPERPSLFRPPRA